MRLDLCGTLWTLRLFPAQAELGLGVGCSEAEASDRFGWTTSASLDCLTQETGRSSVVYCYIVCAKTTQWIGSRRREEGRKTTFADQYLGFYNQASCERSDVHMCKLMLIKQLLSGTESKTIWKPINCHCASWWISSNVYFALSSQSFLHTSDRVNSLVFRCQSTNGASIRTQPDKQNN